jgi:ABC-2 type transport system permease protein
VLPLGSTAPIEPTTVDRSSNSSELQTTAVAEASGPETDGPVNVTVENPLAATQQNPRVAMYAAGIAVLFLLFSATGHAAALLEEAESGTLDRILVSKAGLLHIVCGKWLGIVLLGCLQITVMFLWADVAFKIQLAKHLQGFCVMTVSTAAATASFAMLLATLCKTRSQLNAVSVMVILCMSAVGGSMIPRFAMSDRMKEIGTWTFNAWALDGYQKVFWYQQPLSSLQPEVTVLLGSAAVLGTLTLVLSGRWKRG